MKLLFAHKIIEYPVLKNYCYEFDKSVLAEMYANCGFCRLAMTPGYDSLYMIRIRVNLHWNEAEEWIFN